MTAQASPWDRRDVLRWSVTVFAGGLTSGLAWWLASGRVKFDEQMPFASVAVIGLLLGGYAHLSWLLRGRRAVGVRRLSLLGDPVRRPTAPAAGRSSAGPVFLAVDGRARYHRPGCPLLAGRAAVSGIRAVHEAAARRPCGVCGAGPDDRG